MVLRIRVQTIRPLTGYAGREGQAAIPFAGWLGLLRVLAESLQSSSPLAPDLVGEFSPRGDPQLGERMGDVGLDRSLRDE